MKLDVITLDAGTAGSIELSDEIFGISEIRADLQPIVAQAYAGVPVHMDDIELTMHRRGYQEETHFAFSYTPVRDENGDVCGFFCPCIEITEAHHGVAEHHDRNRRNQQDEPQRRERLEAAVLA